jgi:hypothetical protein
MESYLWVIGTMFFVMLILQLLSFGLTKKGKFVVVFTAFFLSIIGLMAVPTFSLWKICIILFVLISLTTYLLNTKIGSSLFVGNDSIGKKSVNKVMTDLDYNKTMNVEPFRLSLQETAATVEPIEDEEILDAGSFYTQENSKVEEEIMEEEPTDGIDEDISFLLHRNLEIKEELSHDEAVNEMDHIFDIESLLLETTEEFQAQNISTESEKEDDDELPVLTFDSISIETEEQVEFTNPLEDLEEIPLITFPEKELTKVNG